MRIFSRIKRSTLWRAIGLSVGTLAIATFINLFGIHLLGGLAQWEQWLHEGYWYFFAWRVLLYAALVWGWLWARPRILRREATTSAQLRRAELTLAAAVLLMEFTRALPHLS